MKKLLKIGELAKQAQVTVATIRYYQSIHLLEPVSKAENGYSYYDETTISRLQFIKQAQTLQFSLAEIQQVSDSLSLLVDFSTFSGIALEFSACIGLTFTQREFFEKFD